MFAGLKSAVKQGGLFLLEGYRPEQLEFGTSRPPRREYMYARACLESTFSGWEILVLKDYDEVIQEGRAHNGMSALIDLVAASLSSTAAIVPSQVFMRPAPFASMEGVKVGRPRISRRQLRA